MFYVKDLGRVCVYNHAYNDACVYNVRVFYVKGSGPLLRQVLQCGLHLKCGRPPGFTQTAAPRVVPLPTRRRSRN